MAVQIRGINVEIAVRQLARLIVEVNGDVREHPVEELPWLACEPALSRA